MKYTVEVNAEGIFWYKEGTDILHREDGPAVETVDGSKKWCINDKLHREDGPAYEDVNGHKEWWINGQRHRTDGPACEWIDGTKQWIVNGQLHRLDGPAVEFPDGEKYWYYQGQQIKCSSQKEFETWLKEHNSVSNCADKIINVDGTNYKLVRI